MFGLPMEIVGPVLGIGTLIGVVTAALIALRIVSSRFPRPAAPAQLDPATREALEEVHARVGELDLLKQRVGELEERLDFTERLLANRREEPRIGG